MVTEDLLFEPNPQSDDGLDIFFLDPETNGRQCYHSDTSNGRGSQKYILQCQRWVRRQVDIVANILPHPVKKTQVQEMIQIICRRRGRWMTGRDPKRLRAFIIACVYISLCDDGDMPIIEEYAHAADVKKHVFKRYLTYANKLLTSLDNNDQDSIPIESKGAQNHIYMPLLCIQGVTASLRDLIRRYLTFVRLKDRTPNGNVTEKSLNTLQDKTLLQLDTGEAPLNLSMSDTPSTVATDQSPACSPKEPEIDLFSDCQVESLNPSGCGFDLALDDLFSESSKAENVTTVLDLNPSEETASEKSLRERWEESTEKIVRQIGTHGFVASRNDRKNMAVESGQVLLVAGKLIMNNGNNSVISLKLMSEFLNVNKSVLSSASVVLGQRLIQLAVDKGVIGKVVAAAISSAEIKGLKGRARWAILNMIDL